jgi:hypothetical protein
VSRDPVHLDELVAARAGVEGDEPAAARARVYARLARYAERRRRLAPAQPTPWLDRKLDELLDALLELRRDAPVTHR